MNISYNWLKEYVDFDLTPHEVATLHLLPLDWKLEAWKKCKRLKADWKVWLLEKS